MLSGLLVRESNDTAKLISRESFINDASACLVDSEYTLINIVPVNPLLRVKVVDSAADRVLGEGDGAVDLEVFIPKTGGHGHFVLGHVFKYDFGPVFSSHRSIVNGHCSYFLRHRASASVLWQSRVHSGSCNGRVANFIMSALYGFDNDHASGSHRVHNEKQPGPPIQREPGAWSLVRMSTNNLSRLKQFGTKRGTDAVEAPAPSQLGTLTGASAEVTATNHAHTTSIKASSGGGQHARF